MAQPAPTLEQERLCALDRYDVLDTPREEAFDRITRLVRRILDVPIATVTFLDAHRQWFKSRQGLDDGETARELAFCDHAIRAEAPLIVPDTMLDERFADSSMVTGGPRIRFYAGVPLRTSDGHNIGTLCAIDTRPREFTSDQVGILTDLAQMAMGELELRRLATTDCLTGAMSRRSFREEGGRAVSLALRHGHNLICLALDIDYFKHVNDTHGHGVGDRVLAGTAALCQELIRKSDLLGRIGGEEFAILLPHTPRKPALQVAEKLRAAIANQRFEVGNVTVRITASLGVAALDRSLPDIDALLGRADSALYAAKAAGRNQVIAYQPAEPEKATVRRRVLKAGRISFNNRQSSIDCTVRSLSETGAGLDVFTSAGVPKTFELVIDSDAFLRPCQVVVQTEKHVEVKFV